MWLMVPSKKLFTPRQTPAKKLGMTRNFFWSTLSWIEMSLRIIFFCSSKATLVTILLAQSNTVDSLEWLSNASSYLLSASLTALLSFKTISSTLCDFVWERMSWFWWWEEQDWPRWDEAIMNWSSLRFSWSLSSMLLLQLEKWLEEELFQISSWRYTVFL